MPKSKKRVVEITEGILRGLFNAASGHRSHTIFLNDESAELIDQLMKDGWVTYLKNTSNKPWYSITKKLEAKFRDLDELELAQIRHLKIQEELEAGEFEKEDKRAQEVIDNRVNVKKV